MKEIVQIIKIKMADLIWYLESFKYKNSITGKTSNINRENGRNTEQGNTKTKKI